MKSESCYVIVIKNISSSSSHKKRENLKLRDFSFFRSSTFIYKPIMIKKKSMDANNMERQIFNAMKYDLKGHKR